jgi:thiamine biosynthesis lipoprotein
MMPLRRARPLLGTLVEIRLDTGLATAQAQHAVQRAFAAVAEVQSLMSYHDPDSEISRINREGFERDVTVSQPTWEVLNAALQISEQSDGLFDVTVAPVLSRYGFLPHHPAHHDAEPDADWRDIKLLPGRRVRLARRVSIDLGGIAKGYAVDRAVAALQECGVEAGCVNAGGDMRVFGNDSQMLHLRHPRRATALLPAGNITGAAATSAIYFSSRLEAGRRVTPLVDPRNHLPCEAERSVTILADDCMTADALTKVFYADPARGSKLLPAFNARALIVEHDPLNDDCRLYDSAATMPARQAGPEELPHG